MDLRHGAGDGRCRRSRARAPGSATRTLLADRARRARARSSSARRSASACPAGSGAWYALYSFAPRLEVLNGMLQSLIGLDTYADADRRPARRRRCSSQGDAHRARADRRLRHRRLVALQPLGGRVPARRPTSTTTRSTATSPAASAGSPRPSPYCTAADNFTRYLQRGSAARRRSAPLPLRRAAGAACGSTSRSRRSAASGSRVASRRAHVPLDERAASPAASTTSAGCRRACKRERTYDYSLFARDLAGNTRIARAARSG